MKTIETDPQPPDDTQSGTIVAPSAVQGTLPETRVESFIESTRDLAAEDRQRHAGRRARVMRLRAAHWMGVRVPHPDGGEHSVEAILQDEIAQRARIDAERSMGSRKHQRLPGWMRHVPKLVMLGDLILLLYFFAGVTDVDWADPFSAGLLFAALLASIVTVLAFGFFSFTGHRLRSFKDHSGAVRAGDLDGFTKLAVTGSVIGTVTLAALMFLRMHIEVLYALGPRSGYTALVVASAVAVVSILANLLVIGIHAHDGSYEVDRLNKLSAAARRSLARAHRMSGKATAHSDR